MYYTYIVKVMLTHLLTIDEASRRRLLGPKVLVKESQVVHAARAGSG